MAIDTPRIASLLASREASLKELEVVNANIDHLEGRTHSRAERLLSETNTLKALLDTSDQINDYGFEAWHRDFVRLSDLEPSVAEMMWNRLPMSRFKRFQMLFCHKQDLIVPKMMERSDLDTLSLRACLVAPDRIPDHLLVEFGFVDAAVFEELKGDPIARIGKKREYADAMKLAFEGATPIDLGQRRIHRIDRPTDNLRKPYAEGTPVVADEAVGGILYTREYINGNKNGPRQLQVQHFDSAYAALRKTFHEETAYAQEIDGLAACQTDVDRTLWKLNDGYRRGTPDEVKRALWQEAESVILRYNDMLSTCVDQHKVEAYEFLLDASDLRDTTGKPNISKVMSKMTASLTRVAKRFNEMKPKGGFNAHDRLILHAQIQREERTMLANRHGIRDHALDLEAGATTPKTIESSLVTSVRDLEKVQLRPLAVSANAMIRQIQSLTPDNAEVFKDQLLTLHILGKIQGLTSALEWIRGRIAQNGVIDFAREIQFTKQVEKAFNGEQIFLGRAIPYLEDIMGELSAALARLRGFLEECALTPPNDAKTRVAVREALSTYLDAFDTEDSTDKITSWLPEAIPYETPFKLTNNK